MFLIYVKIHISIKHYNIDQKLITLVHPSVSIFNLSCLLMCITILTARKHFETEFTFVLLILIIIFKSDFSINSSFPFILRFQLIFFILKSKIILNVWYQLFSSCKSIFSMISLPREHLFSIFLEKFMVKIFMFSFYMSTNIIKCVCSKTTLRTFKTRFFSVFRFNFCLLYCSFRFRFQYLWSHIIIILPVFDFNYCQIFRIFC